MSRPVLVTAIVAFTLAFAVAAALLLSEKEARPAAELNVDPAATDAPRDVVKELRRDLGRLRANRRAGDPPTPPSPAPAEAATD